MPGPEVPSIGIDFSQYAALKKEGKLTLGNAGNSKMRGVIFKKKFDEDNGEELDPLIIPVNPKELHRAIAAFGAVIDGMNEMLKDLGKLGIDVSKPAPLEQQAK